MKLQNLSSMGGSFETGEREEQLRRRRGSPWSITAAVHNRLQLAQGYNGACWSICFFAAVTWLLHAVQTETAVTELTWKEKCHNFFLTSNHIIPYDDKIGPKQWDYDRVQWQNWATVWVTQACVLSNFNCTHSSPRHRRTFGPFFGTTWKLLWDLATKSTYSDIFLRTAPHHASQTFPDWETSFKAPAQKQGAEICIYIRGLNCKITIGWCVYQSKNSV